MQPSKLLNVQCKPKSIANTKPQANCNTSDRSNLLKDNQLLGENDNMVDGFLYLHALNI